VLVSTAPRAADELDWSVGLRGSYSSSSVSGGSFEAVVAPEVSLTLGGEGATLTLGAGAALAVDLVGNVRVADMHVSLDGNVALSADTTLAGSADLSLTQAAPGSPAVLTDTASAPLLFTGTAAGSATTHLGPLELSARISGGRVIEGDETLYDATVIDHADGSSWRDGAGLRVGFAMSPLLTVFADASVDDTRYDAASPSLGVLLDHRIYVLRGGVGYAQGEAVSAEVSGGRAIIDYTDGTLADAGAWVASASVKLVPDEGLTLGATLDTTVAPSGSVAGDTDVAYVVGGNAAYAVNPWLTLRGSAGASATQTVAAGLWSWGYSAGAGLDLTTSEHVAWSADYLFTHDGSGPEDIHRATIGLTIKR
jgi:hypothetical protein